MSSGENGESSTVQVVSKAARILDCFTVTRPRLRAAEITHLTGMPASTVARLLRTLTDGNLLQRGGGYYSIGLRVMAWSAAANAGSDLIAAASPLVNALRDQCGESCGLYVRQGATRVSVLQAESTRSIIYRGYVGQVMPLNAGAAGKALMAFDATAYAAAVAEGLPPFTPRTITDPGLLAEELAQVRHRGWAFSEEEREEGLNSVAAPVFGPGGSVIAAVAAGGPSFRLTAETARQASGPVTACAAAISRALLWNGEENAEEEESS